MVPLVSAKVFRQAWQIYCRFLCEWTPMRSLAPQSELGHTINSGRRGGSVYLVIPLSKHRCARLCQIELQPMLQRYRRCAAACTICRSFPEATERNDDNSSALSQHEEQEANLLLRLSLARAI